MRKDAAFRVADEFLGLMVSQLTLQLNESGARSSPCNHRSAIAQYPSKRVEGFGVKV